MTPGRENNSKRASLQHRVEFCRLREPSTMAAIRTKVRGVDQASARTLSRGTGQSRRKLRRKSFFSRVNFSHSSTRECRPPRTVKGSPAKPHRGDRETHLQEQRRKDPIPPSAPTSPVTISSLSWEISRHELHPAPLPMPQGGA